MAAGGRGLGGRGGGGWGRAARAARSTCREHLPGAEADLGQRENVRLSRSRAHAVRMVRAPVEGQRRAPAGAGHLSLTLRGRVCGHPRGPRDSLSAVGLGHPLLSPPRPPEASCPRPGPRPAPPRPIDTQGAFGLRTHLLLPLRHEIWPLTGRHRRRQNRGSASVAWPLLRPVCPSEGALCGSQTALNAVSALYKNPAAN